MLTTLYVCYIILFVVSCRTGDIDYVFVYLIVHGSVRGSLRVLAYFVVH